MPSVSVAGPGSYLIDAYSVFPQLPDLQFLSIGHDNLLNLRWRKGWKSEVPSEKTEIKVHKIDRRGEVMISCVRIEGGNYETQAILFHRYHHADCYAYFMSAVK